MSEQQVARVRIRNITPLGQPEAGIFRLDLDCPAFMAGWRAGQFVMVREVRTDTRLTWARPFCISHTDQGSLTLYFQVVGRATREMAKLQADQELDIWGPLGNSLEVQENTPTLLLAGGMGIAPLLAYALQHPQPENLSLEFGHRLPLACYPFERFSEIRGITAASSPETCLDDRECFLGLLEERVRDLSGKGLVLACGPLPFLKFIQGLAVKHNTRAQISLETRMACGIGACLGCVVKAADAPDAARHFTQTCTSGPNFWADRVEI